MSSGRVERFSRDGTRSAGLRFGLRVGLRVGLLAGEPADALRNGPLTARAEEEVGTGWQQTPKAGSLVDDHFFFAAAVMRSVKLQM